MGTLKTIDCNQNNDIKNGCYFGDDTTLERFIYSSSSSKQLDLSSLKSLTTIETGSFKNVKNVELITLPATVSEIKEKAFENCQDLRAITCENENAEITIQSDAFTDCYALDYVYIKAKKITIEKDAFSGCSNLRAIILDCSQKILRNNAFSSLDLVIYAKKTTNTNNTNIESYCKRNDIAYEELK